MTVTLEAAAPVTTPVTVPVVAQPAARTQSRREKYADFTDLPAGFDPSVPGLGDGNPVILAVDEDRHLTYTWRDQSPRVQDWNSRESGYVVSRLSVTYQTPQMVAAGIAPREVAYLNTTSTTPELVASLFPTPFHWADENTSASFGFRWKDEVSPQEIWAAAYTHLRRDMTPPSAVGNRCWGAYSASDAPEDARVLASELATVEKHFARQMRGFIRCLSMPFVDYSHVDGDPGYAFGYTYDEHHPGPIRGTGIGYRMYVLAARHLAATRGTALRGSGLQSDEAQALWTRLIADPDVPTRKTQRTFYKPTAEQTQTYWCIDYTRTSV